MNINGYPWISFRPPQQRKINFWIPPLSGEVGDECLPCLLDLDIGLEGTHKLEHKT